MSAAIDKYAQGILLTFGGQKFTATSISVSPSAKEYDVTHCAIEEGPRKYRYGPYKNTDVQVEFLGTVTAVSLTVTQQFSFTFSGPGTAAQSAWPSTGGVAICTQYSASAVAGDLYKGSMTFKLT